MIFNNVNQVIKDSIQELKSINADKRDMLKDMCIDYYQHTNTEQYIQKYFSGTLQEEIPLYTVNMTRRLIRLYS